MRLNRKQAFGLASALALIVAALIYFTLNSATQQAPVAPEMATVVVATTNIPAFETITAGMLTTKQVTASIAPTNVLTAPSQGIGRLAQSAITKGQLVTTADIAQADLVQGLTFVIPAGKRAVTVELDPISGVGGFVFPGDHIDILATMEQGETVVTRTILQNIEVLAMNEQTVRPRPSRGEQDKDSEDSSESPVTETVKSATLAVTLEDAQKLVLAAHDGSIHMLLRSRNDVATTATPESTSDWALLGLDEPAVKNPETTDSDGQSVNADMPSNRASVDVVASGNTPPPAAPSVPAGPTIEVIRGREHTTVTTNQ